MPAICAFVDLHSVSLLLYVSPEKYWFKNFPYVYSKAIFSSSFTETDFYKGLFFAFCGEHEIKLEDCAVLMTGFLEPPVVNFPVKLKKSLYEVFSSIEKSYPILVNNYSIFTSDFCFSNATIRPIHKPNEHIEVEEENYYANLNLYPQIIPSELPVQIDIDRNIASLLRAKIVFPYDKPLLFCGSRFSRGPLYAELDYLLMLDIVKNSGVYEIFRDTNSSAILTALLRFHDQNAVIESTLSSEGTLVSSLYSLECMIGSNEGTSQLVQMEKNRILVVPVEQDQQTNVVIKSHDLGTIEKKINGGKLGVIFDTRENKGILAEDIKVFSQSLRSFKERES